VDGRSQSSELKVQAEEEDMLGWYEVGLLEQKGCNGCYYFGLDGN
jgi:hypothetical protein